MPVPPRFDAQGQGGARHRRGSRTGPGDRGGVGRGRRGRLAALHRIGEPIEVAGVVVFLASPAGQTVLVDVGWTAR